MGGFRIDLGGPASPRGGRAGEVAGRVFMAFFAIIWCTITGVFAVIVIGGILMQLDAERRFEAADGTVVASKVRTHSDSNGSTFEPAIRYRYKVAGREYAGERYAYGQFSSSASGHADEVVRRHPAGKHVTVYYDPHNPSEAVLAMGVQPQQWFMLLFLQPFLLVGIGLVGGLAAGVVRRRRMRAFLAAPLWPPCYVPGWGQLRAERDGFRVYPAPLPGERLLAFAAGYGVTCFLSIFAVGFLSGFSPPTWAVQAAFGTAAGVGVAAAAADALKTGAGVLHINDGAGRLTVSRRREPVDLALADVEGWTVCAVPSKWKSEGSPTPTQPQLAVLARDGSRAAVHSFPGTGDDSFALARAVGEYLAGVTRKPLKAE